MKAASLAPSQFEVNEIWIAVKVNERPITIKEGYVNLYVVMDAASTYIIGQAFALTSNTSPPLNEVEAIFEKGWESKHQWPKKILISYQYDEANSFNKAAKNRGIEVEYVSTSRLLAFITPLRESLRSINVLI